MYFSIITINSEIIFGYENIKGDRLRKCRKIYIPLNINDWKNYNKINVPCSYDKLKNLSATF